MKKTKFCGIQTVVLWSDIKNVLASAHNMRKEAHLTSGPCILSKASI